ncbi:MAG: hypothetical protein Q7T73_03345 [Beijerinckiaceae bacterium]|nr:hypothetical protein [Beijerinckiaceae bacterium]
MKRHAMSAVSTLVGVVGVACLVSPVGASEPGPDAVDDHVSQYSTQAEGVLVRVLDNDVFGSVPSISLQAVPVGVTASIEGDAVRVDVSDVFAYDFDSPVVYRLCDESGLCDEASIEIAYAYVEPAPDPPAPSVIAHGDSATVRAGHAAVVDVAANDVVGKPRSVRILRVPKGLRAGVTRSGRVLVSPTSNAGGKTLSLTYSISDSNGSSSARLRVLVRKH